LNDPAPASLEDLASRLDELSGDLRRQGRAAVAAQAAAEACLAALEARAEPRPPEPPRHWLEPLLPVADAIDRISARAASLVQAHPPRRRLLPWPFDAAPPPDADLVALQGGLRILRAQLEQALESQGVRIDRRVGVPMDPRLHRVVEVRPGRGPEGTIVEVLRPGYSLGGRVVREAEVAVSSPGRRR
jgi:molecular chaperone GrpE